MISLTRKTLSWLCAASMILPMGLAVPSGTAQAQVRQTQRTSAFTCANNRFTNGDFSNAPAGTAFGQVEYEHHQDINVAVGWKAPWSSAGSLADLFSPTEQIGVAGQIAPPIAPDGNYAAIWIGNINESDAGFREGMYNQLVTPILANSGNHQFTFKTADMATAGTGVSYIGVYGIKRGPNDPPIAAPSGHNTPSNKNLYGAGKVVLLATVQLPASIPARTWQQQTVTFPTSNFGSLTDITHVFVTKADAADGAVTATQRRYIAFDDFCMQNEADVPGSGNTGNTPTTPTNTNCPGTGCTDQSYSTCCPPTTRFNLGTMLQSMQPNISGDYYLKFTLNPALDAQMTAYGNYLKLLDPSYTGMAMTIRQFDGGSGNAPVISGGPLEPEKAIYWNSGTTAGAQWPAGDLFSPSVVRPVNNWTVVETVVWHTGPNRPWSLDCAIKRIAFRPQVVGGRSMPGARGFMDYRGPAPAAAAQRPARH